MDDYRQSLKYCQYFCKKGWFLENIGSTRVLIKELPLIGSILKIQRGSPYITPLSIDTLALAHKALLVVVEPAIISSDPDYKNVENELHENGFNDFDFFLSPTKTSYIDLTLPPEQILSGFDHSTQKIIKKNIKADFEIRTIKNIEEFYLFLKLFCKKHRLYNAKRSDWMNKWAVFEKDIILIGAYKNNQLIGANMLLQYRSTTFGIFLPALALGKDLNVSTSLIWEGIIQAKKLGSKTFDLNGMYDPRYNAPINWKDFTNFKKKFKGKEVEFMIPKIKVYTTALKPLEKIGVLWLFMVHCN